MCSESISANVKKKNRISELKKKSKMIHKPPLKKAVNVRVQSGGGALAFWELGLDWNPVHSLTELVSCSHLCTRPNAQRLTALTAYLTSSVAHACTHPLSVTTSVPLPVTG